MGLPGRIHTSRDVRTHAQSPTASGSLALKHVFGNFSIGLLIIAALVASFCGGHVCCNSVIRARLSMRISIGKAQNAEAVGLRHVNL